MFARKIDVCVGCNLFPIVLSAAVRFIGVAGKCFHMNLMVLTDNYFKHSVSQHGKGPVRGAKCVIFQFGLYSSIRRLSHSMDNGQRHAQLYFCYFHFFCAISSYININVLDGIEHRQHRQLTWETFLVVSTYRKLVMRCRKIWKTKLIIKSTRFFFHVVRFFPSFFSGASSLYSRSNDYF